jgi:restriction endonuclease S subunit
VITSTRLKRIASLTTETVDTAPRPRLVLENLEPRTGRLTPGTDLNELVPPEPGTADVAAGDVLFGKLRPYLAKSWVADRPVRASTELLCLRPRPEIESRWLGYLAISSPFIDWAVAASDGAKMPRTSWERLGEFRLDLPPLAIQKRVASHLDRETAHIDALIVAKGRMIELIDERGTARRAWHLLRGCDPVTGAGAIPQRWQLRNLSAAMTLHRGHDLPIGDRVSGPVPVVSSGGYSGWHNRPICEPPGVVTGRYGTIGDVYFVEVPYWPLNTTLYVSDYRGNDPRWTYHALASLPLRIDAEKSAVTGINRNVVGRLKVPVPPRDEQQRVAAEGDRVVDWVTRTRAAVETELRLLQERRQALITAAVFGQLDIPVVA